MRRPSDTGYRLLYEVRVQAGIIAALLVCLAVVHWWPNELLAPDERVYTTQPQEVVQLDEIQPTRQAQRPPPPPPPPLPVVVPNDVELEEVELDFADTFLPVPEPADETTEQEGEPNVQTTSLARVEVGPKPVRIVEPAYTREARRRKIRAEVVVELRIDERGRVAESRVVERFLLGDDDDDPKEPVSQLGYGLEDAAIAAAERWVFRPARQNGRPVASYTTLTLGFGK